MCIYSLCIKHAFNTTKTPASGLNSGGRNHFAVLFPLLARLHRLRGLALHSRTVPPLERFFGFQRRFHVTSALISRVHLYERGVRAQCFP